MSPRRFHDSAFDHKAKMLNVPASHFEWVFDVKSDMLYSHDEFSGVLIWCPDRVYEIGNA